MPEARGSTPRGRTHHGGIAQRPERLSHTQRAVCSNHTPVTDGKEVVVCWPTAVRRCGLCDVLDDPSSRFDFEGDSSCLRGGARAIPVAKRHHFFGE